MDTNFVFKRDGRIMYDGTCLIGVWFKVDVWKMHGGRHDFSGNKLVPYYYQCFLFNGQSLFAYSRKEMVRFSLNAMVKDLVTYRKIDVRKQNIRDAFERVCKNNRLLKDLVFPDLG